MNKKLALKLGILTNGYEVCIPSLSSILLAVYVYNESMDFNLHNLPKTSSAQSFS